MKLHWVSLLALCVSAIAQNVEVGTPETDLSNEGVEVLFEADSDSSTSSSGGTVTAGSPNVPQFKQRVPPEMDIHAESTTVGDTEQVPPETSLQEELPVDSKDESLAGPEFAAVGDAENASPPEDEQELPVDGKDEPSGTPESSSNTLDQTGDGLSEQEREELEELDRLIALQQRRVELLNKAKKDQDGLDREVAAPSPSISPIPPASPGDATIEDKEEALLWEDEEDFLPMLISRRTAVTASAGIALKLPRRSQGEGLKGKHRRKRNVVNVGITATDTFQLVFTDLDGDVPGRVLHTTDPLHTKPITNIHCSAGAGGKTTTHWVMTGSEDGTCLVYSLNAWIEPEEIGTELAEDAGTEPTEPKFRYAARLRVTHEHTFPAYTSTSLSPGWYHPYLPDNGFPDPEHLAIAEKQQQGEPQENVEAATPIWARTPGAVRPVTAVQIYQRQKYVLFNAAYSDGTIRTFLKNGTLRSDFYTGNSTIVDLKVSAHQQMMYVTDSGLGVFRMSRIKSPIDHYCDFSVRCIFVFCPSASFGVMILSGVQISFDCPSTPLYRTLRSKLSPSLMMSHTST